MLWVLITVAHFPDGPLTVADEAHFYASEEACWNASLDLQRTIVATAEKEGMGAAMRAAFDLDYVRVDCVVANPAPKGVTG